MPTLVPDPATLERNLTVLQRRSPLLASALRAAQPAADLQLLIADDGAATGTLGSSAQQRQLASRRRPLEEARRLAETVDLSAAGGVVILGFALGHHVRLLAERMRGAGVIIVFEPDLALLRAVLERIDHSAWLMQSKILFLHDADDPGAISAAARGVEGLLAMGVRIVEHPASRPRLGERGRAFADRFTSVMRAVRTTVATTLVQSEVTVRNLLMNVDRYATCAGIGDLKGSAAGRPAIVVSAGPSLRRNIDLLKKPGVHERFIIIAVQTVLRQLLARGIRPHFVTALDYHQISRRFYEGLTAPAVDGITLVAEAKANPAILEAFPGEIRMIGDGFLDRLLGDELARPLGTVKAGATVAHLAYYLARHMGCDPVILIGQDLGFTDGQYYSAGAAIHDVWASELSQFNTLEMMEWQRIVRARSYLHRTRDVLGRPIYTDEQMATYRMQFERDFAADNQLGLRVIDATEGGVEKQHASIMSLAEALEAFRPQQPLRLRRAEGTVDGEERLSLVKARLGKVGNDAAELVRHSGRTIALLEQMLAHHEDQPRVNRLIGKVDAIRAEVEKLEPAFSLVEFLNQAGTFKRVRADRNIDLDESLTGMQRQRRQIERDIVNVRWVSDAAARLGELLEGAIDVLEGGARRTGDLIEDAEERGNGGPGVKARRRVLAMIALDCERSGMGTRRTLAEPFLCGRNPLRMTLERLAQCRELDGIIIVSDDPARAGLLAGPGIAALEIAEAEMAPMRERRRAVLGARLWTRSCWRGGLAGMTVYDEACCPALLAPIMEQRQVDAAAVIGADWALVDPALVDAAVERYRRRPDGSGAHRLTFCHAAPGLGAAVVERTLMKELAAQGGSERATIGGMLGYVPTAPSADPIARPVCVAAVPAVRDAQFRFIPDSEPRRALLARALGSLGDGVLRAGALEIVSAIAPTQTTPPEGPPQELMLELCPGRRTSGARSRWLRGLSDPIERPAMPLGLAERILTEFGRLRHDGALTLGGAGDPLLHPDLLRIVHLARRAGVAGVHIRTDLLCEREQLDALLEAADVISIDLMAESAHVYRVLMGADQFQRVRGNLEYLLMQRGEPRRSVPNSPPVPWIVPRMTRCDAVYEELESFFDRWVLAAGAAVIDPLPARQPQERIEPLPVPRRAVQRLARERMVILSDGRVPADESDLSGERCIGDVRQGLMPVWRMLGARRFDGVESSPFNVDAVVHGSAARDRIASGMRT
jgi:hypothetical protein